VDDATDRCVSLPEDRDGVQDDDGCPDIDDDNDSVIDSYDRCRREPEDIDLYQDGDGCPDPDNDEDRVADASDRCPRQAEDIDSFQDDDGCPDKDNDGDSLADAQDACADAAGPVENQGCPWPDRDSDGVIDRFDNCPTWRGTPENNGCASKQLVKLTESRIELSDTIVFASGEATIQKRSNRMLDQVGLVLKAHPELDLVIEGHTDNVGDAQANMTLSRARADSVMSYLLGRGVDASRLSAVGHGATRPIADNATEQGRAANRRVEIATQVVARPR
jgi:outer membrane protein OmpA-like peptidoglycan-associated protein